jgi:hypothetical protein
LNSPPPQRRKAVVVNVRSVVIREIVIPNSLEYDEYFMFRDKHSCGFSSSSLSEFKVVGKHSLIYDMRVPSQLVGLFHCRFLLYVAELGAWEWLLTSGVAVYDPVST